MLIDVDFVDTLTKDRKIEARRESASARKRIASLGVPFTAYSTRMACHVEGKHKANITFLRTLRGNNGADIDDPEVCSYEMGDCLEKSDDTSRMCIAS